jgi:uncharacterized paraquat-inducible protein A
MIGKQSSAFNVDSGMIMKETHTTIIRCASCGAGNRIPAEKMGTPAKCGKCGRELPAGDGRPAYKMRCSDCGARNKIPAPKINAGPKCGKCSTPLPTKELFKPQPVMVTDASFEDEILKSPLPALMFAWAPW